MVKCLGMDGRYGSPVVRLSAWLAFAWATAGAGADPARPSAETPAAADPAAEGSAPEDKPAPKSKTSKKGAGPKGRRV